MKIVDSRYDCDAKQLMKRTKELEAEAKSLECALRVSEKNGAHMDAMARFFRK
jgi:hypothetical protein